MQNDQNINKAVTEVIQSAVDQSLKAIQFNLANVIGGLLCSIELENDKLPDGENDIEKLINIIIQTSHYKGKEGEEYATYDQVLANPILDRLTQTLQVNGIEQSWNMGRNKIHGPKSKLNELADALEQLTSILLDEVDVADKDRDLTEMKESLAMAKKALARVDRIVK